MMSGCGTRRHLIPTNGGTPESGPSVDNVPIFSASLVVHKSFHFEGDWITSSVLIRLDCFTSNLLALVPPNPAGVEGDLTDKSVFRVCSMHYPVDGPPLPRT